MRQARSSIWAVVTALALTLLLAPILLAGPESYGLPAKLRNLTDLTPILERKDLTAAQKTEVLMAWLVEERRHPSPTTRGLGGGDIDSGYIQAQLVKAMSELGDPLSLRETTADPEADPAVRDAASLALGDMYDIAQIPRLLTILEGSPEPDFRALAATSLGAMGAVEARPALQRALQDGFARRGGGRTKTPRTAYPVREAAQVALRVLVTEDPEILRYRKDRIEAFTRRLQAAKAALVAALADSDWTVRWRAAEGLGAVAGLSAVGPLVRQLAAEAANEEALRKQGRPVPRYGYVPWPEFLERQLAMAAREVLKRDATAAGVESREELAKTMASREQPMRVRAEIALILGELGDRRAIPTLIEALTSETSGALRSYAAEALGDLGAQEAVPALEQALSDPYVTPDGKATPLVRDAAARALRKLGR